MRKPQKSSVRDYQTVTLYDVLVHMLHPVLARPGDRLVVRPGNPRPIVVVRKIAGEWGPVRIGPPEFEQLREMASIGVLHRRWPRF